MLHLRIAGASLAFITLLTVASSTGGRLPVSSPEAEPDAGIDDDDSVGRGVHSYLRRHPEVTEQKTLEVHYASHQRKAFRIKAANYALAFKLASPDIGLAALRAAPQAQSLIEQGLNLRVTSADGRVFESARASEKSRLNIFRHGPHYYDAHVFDLLPTSAGGDTLGVRGEVVFHAYPERLYLEVELHGTAPASVASAEVEWTLDAASCDRYLTSEGTKALRRRTVYRDRHAEGNAVLGVTGHRGTFGLILPDSAGTASLGLVEEAGQVRITQRFALGAGGADVHFGSGTSRSLYARLFLGAEDDFGGLKAARQLERHPLSGEDFRVGGNARFRGYDARKGHYTITARSGLHGDGPVVGQERRAGPKNLRQAC